VIALARLPLARLSRTPRAWLGIGAWCILALGFALTARRSGAAHGADRVLLEGYAAFALPLLSYALVGAALGARSMKASTASLVSFGASPSRAALAEVLVSAAGCAVAGSLLAAAVAALAHGAGDPPAVRDALTSAYAGCLGGLAYGSWYALGAGFGRRGGGRVVLLLVDFLASGDDGVMAMATPRAHVRSLLGGVPVMDFSGRASAVALAVMALAYGAMAVARAGRH
jgi:hypothetical protein